MRALTMTLLALVAAGCAGGPQEAQDETHSGDHCPEEASGYHEGATGGEASTDPPPVSPPPEPRTGGGACPDPIGQDSVKETPHG